MFGPLPLLHRMFFVVAAMVVCIGAGAWLAYMTPIPIVVAAGALLGAAAGLLAAFSMLHGRRGSRSSL